VDVGHLFCGQSRESYESVSGLQTPTQRRWRCSVGRGMTSVEDLTQSLGRELLTLVQKETRPIINPYWWKGKAIMWLARDDNLRTQMLRFVDVFPVLKTTEEKNQHMREHFIQGLQRTPPIFRIADASSRFPIGAKIVASVAEQGIKIIGQHFIVKGLLLKRF